MTSTRATTPIVRLAAAAIVATAILPLSGCLYGSIPAEPPVVDEPISSPEPTDDAPVDAGGELPDTLTFEAGALLPGSTYVEWSDGLMMDDGWDLTSPDTGNGTWGYTLVDGTCTAAFWQGTLDGLTPSGDDSTDSDAVIAFFLNAEVSDVTTAAKDTELSYQFGGAGGVEARAVIGEQGDRTWTIIARAFGSLGVGLYTLVDCTGGDINTTLEEVLDKNAVVAY